MTPVFLPLAAIAWCFGSALLALFSALEQLTLLIGIGRVGKLLGAPILFVPGIALVSPLYIAWAYCIWYQKLPLCVSKDVSIGNHNPGVM